MLVSAIGLVIIKAEILKLDQDGGHYFSLAGLQPRARAKFALVFGYRAAVITRGWKPRQPRGVLLAGIYSRIRA